MSVAPHFPAAQTRTRPPVIAPHRATALRRAGGLHVVPSAPVARPTPAAPPTAPAGASTAPERPALSRREVEVLLAWLAAESKAEAAGALYITASTVNTHLTRIRAKYTAVGRPARSKANLFARAIQDGYTRLDEW
ncbi:LuxR C-terminal-related transcriptional regulator [Williamsia deligens]|uniref:LuxR C-terminal-related transcriptional regulator n=1 Tax=Williamsia deligens TaxID=321325 RepID=A0ABW3G698_9NOCA|nr:LuxR C-terminal-related transcriptional regulator [Williamsia deligens]MCP2194681.1 DNA-binding transcriptional regulator, CsgD family [Williamsia deligens]